MHSLRSLLAGALLFAVISVQPFAQDGPVAPSAPAQGGGVAPPGGGGGRATFPAQQRPPGDPAVIARGNGLYGVYCRACHGADLRGGDQGGPNLLRSPIVLNDQAGELLLPIVQNGQRGTGVMPPIPLMPDDVRAVAEYIHSVAATMRGQGSPPPGAAPLVNVLVGDTVKGQAYFTAKCGSCHSVSADLSGIASRVPDPIALQNYWLSAGGGLGRGGRGGPGASGPLRRDVMVTVTPTTGVKVQGALVRLDDFYVVVRLEDGTERSFSRVGEVPLVEVRDPYEPHRKLLPTYSDSDIHDVTAYLMTLK
jgi:cytochrome c oxidase cbb3-type subunit III